MKILLYSNLINIVVLPVLIYGWGPLPPFGVYGAAWATILAETWGGILFLRYLRSTSIGPEIFRSLRPDWPLIWRIVRIAFPRSVQRGLEVIAAILLIRIVADFGTAAVAAYGIGLRLDLVFKSPGWGLGTAATTLVGQSLGALDPERAEKSTWGVAAIYVVLNAVAGLCFVFIPEGVMGFFTTDPEVIRLGVPYLKLMYWGFLFMAIGMVFERALGGSGDTFTPMLITGVGLMGLKIPLALFLAHTMKLGVLGLWIAIAVSYAIWGVAMALWFHRGGWKTKEI
jgi:putative MATE family efflux protein